MVSGVYLHCVFMSGLAIRKPLQLKHFSSNSNFCPTFTWLQRHVLCLWFCNSDVFTFYSLYSTKTKFLTFICKKNKLFEQFINTCRKQCKSSAFIYSLLEEMVLFRTKNGSIPCFIYGTLKWFYIEPFFFFLKKGSIGQVWNPRVIYRTHRNPFFKSA